MHQIAASLAPPQTRRANVPARGPAPRHRPYTANGLNQLTSVGGAATAHDTKGNLTTDPTSGKSYTYSSENLLTASTGGTAATLAYDPAMRLYQLTGAATTRFGYDGLAMIAEYNGSNVLQRRFVHGPGVDEPLVHYEGALLTDRRWLHADERGSVIAMTDAAGSAIVTNRYDEYGKPQSSNVGRFQYTGQTWLPELGAYYYKARIYSPTFGGRFLQTDPIGTAGGINLYAYVGNDPVNMIDPSGLKSKLPPPTRTGSIIPGVEPIGASSCSGNCVSGDWVYNPGSPTSVEGSGESGTIVVSGGGWVWVPNVQLASNGGPGHNLPPLGLGTILRRGLGWIGLILSMEGDTCKTCNQPKFPTDKSNLDHIFSGKTGHFTRDTPHNRSLITNTIAPNNYVGTNEFGVNIFRSLQPNGTQVWVEVYGNQISNAGLNQTPIYGY